MTGEMLVPDASGHSRIQYRLCAHGEDKRLPMGDQLFIQKVMLELNEEDFLKVANVHPAR